MATQPDSSMREVHRPSFDERSLRHRLAGLIDRYRDSIVENWLDRVRREVVRKGVEIDATQLRNSIGDYLDRIGESLREDASVEISGTTAWLEVAREHAMHRMQLGFDIGQLVHEFVLLRRVLTQLIEREQLPYEAQSVTLVADFIDAAIATSIGRYVETRDQSARRVQAEHVGFLTHELRNPLSAAMLAATQLKRGGKASGERARVFELLESSHRRLRRLIDEVLLEERFATDNVDVRPVDARFGEFIAEALTAARAAAHVKGLAFAVNYDPNVLIHFDPHLSASAVQNLADNAVKFTDQGKVTIDVEDREQEIVLHVRDSCSGLPPEELAKIFEPFQRGHSGKAGSGLGLAIARRAVEAQGGRINVESSPGSGCHFWFTLPKFVQAREASKGNGANPDHR